MNTDGNDQEDFHKRFLEMFEREEREERELQQMLAGGDMEERMTALLRESAMQGDVHAQVELASMYRAGRALPQNDQEAAHWYLLAARQGHAEAQSMLGRLFLLGEGVPQDDAQAEAWLLKANAQGDLIARGLIRERFCKQAGCCPHCGVQPGESIMGQ